jgi:putative CocE/NonD family hydrolase
MMKQLRYLFALWLAVAALGLMPLTAQEKKDAAPEQPEVQLTAAQLDAVSGQYADKNEPDEPDNFYAREGKLYLESYRTPALALKALSATEFEIPQYKVTFKFTLGTNGQAESFAVASAPDRLMQRVGPPQHYEFPEYTRSEAMIPMRDGVKLHVVIVAPKDGSKFAAKPLPIILERTPYGVDWTSPETIIGSRPELARAGYIFVSGDIRGRYKSEGEFRLNAPLSLDHTNPKNVDESTDAYDTVAWLIKNVANNNGRVGVVGTSYDGFTATEAGIDPHPAVKAISPQAPMIDAWMGDDFFHNGAFRQSYGYDYAILTELTKENSEVDYGKDKDGKPKDGYDFFLERGSFEQNVKASGIRMLPSWEHFIEHPAYDEIWRSRGVQNTLTKLTVPTLSVGGYYDQEDMYGPQEEYATLEPLDTGKINFMALGPWCHGCWAMTTRHFGALQYGEPIGLEFRRDIEAKFFAKYLKDEPGFDVEDTASFQTGSNKWKRYSHFPPLEATELPLHLEGDGKATWSEPKTEIKTSYESDPANPVPYRARPIQVTYGPGSKWRTWLVADQRFVDGRKDVAVWKLPVLKKDLVVTGDVIADLFVSTTGSDTDIVVKLIDEYPADDADPTMRGYELMTNSEIFRGRYLQSFEKPAALRPGSVHEFKYSLHGVDHVFKAGHTVMVEVQSTWFPLYDRNPQTFVPNIMKAKPEDYKAATITILSDPGHDSSVILPVMNSCDHIECF